MEQEKLLGLILSGVSAIGSVWAVLNRKHIKNLRDMKRIKIAVTLSGFILFLSYMASGQAVFAPVKGAKWTYTYSSTFYSVFGMYGHGKAVLKAEYFNDTLIGSRTYKLINIKQEQIDTIYKVVSVTGTTVKWDTSIRIEKMAYRFLTRQSQDTVWSLSRSGDSTERLYFIYLKNPGVFYMDKLGPGEPDSNRWVVINSILSLSFGNRTFRAWKGMSHFPRKFIDDTSNYDSLSLTFLDRIGPVNDVMGYLAFGGNCGCINAGYKYGLVCYEDNEVGEIKFMDLDCDLKLVPTQNISRGIMLESYFNSLSRTIEIRIEDDNINQLQLSLVNISGQVVLTTLLMDSHSSIRIPDSLPGGIYFTHFLSKTHGKSAVKKIFVY